MGQIHGSIAFELGRVVAFTLGAIVALGVLVAGCTAVDHWRSDKVVASSRRASVHSTTWRTG